MRYLVEAHINQRWQPSKSRAIGDKISVKRASRALFSGYKMAAYREESTDLGARNSGQKRPFKICNASRDGKKGIACSTLEELKRISSVRFMLSANCRVFLESDGTEVDNEEYFQFVTPQTLFMVTESNEKWIKPMEILPGGYIKVRSMCVSVLNTRWSVDNVF